MPSLKMKFLGVTILQGVEFSIFPIDFEWALQQCSATALPVIVSCVSAALCGGCLYHLRFVRCYYLYCLVMIYSGVLLYLV